MLHVFRKNANNWFMVIVFAAITFVFVFTFGSWGGGKLSNDLPIAAIVNGKVIERAQFRVEYANRFRTLQMYRPGYTAEKARDEGLQDQVLELLISQELLAQAAEDHGIAVSDEDVAKTIDERYFSADKPFDADEYKRLVNGIFGTTEPRFEEQVRRQLLAARMEALLADAQHISDKEIRETFDSRNNKAELEIVKVDPLFFKAAAKDIADADAAAYVAAHRADVEKFYNEHMNRYRQPKKVGARHILVKAAEDAPDDVKAKAKEKIEAAKKRIAGGEDFAEVAKAVSEDSSAANGGSLGEPFGPGAMVKPFEDAAFAMKVGEVSDIVQTRFGFHIIKVESVVEPVTKEIKDVEVEIAKQLAREGAQKAEALKVANAALAEAQKGVAFADLKIAGLVKPTADGTPPPKPGEVDPYAPRVETTGSFAKTSRAIPRVGVSPELTTLAFETLTMDKPLHTAVVEVSSRYFVVRLKSRDVPDESKLAAERDSIEAGLVAGRRAQLVDEFTKVLKEKAKIEKLGTLLDGAA